MRAHPRAGYLRTVTIPFQSPEDPSSQARRANQLALEAGFLHGRCIWFDPYPFVDDVRFDETEGDEGRPKWVRKPSWELYRLAHDWWWYLRNHHALFAVALAHPLSAVPRGHRAGLLLAQALFTAFGQFLLQGELIASEEETLHDLSLEDPPPAHLSRRARELLVTVEVLGIAIGAIMSTCWEQAAKLAAAPPCVSRERLHGLEPGRRCCLVFPRVQDGAVAAALLVSGALFALACASRAQLPHLLMHAAEALANSFLLSALVDSMVFFSARSRQLALFGNYNGLRARMYPLGFEWPKPPFLIDSQRRGYAWQLLAPPPPPPARRGGIGHAVRSGSALSEPGATAGGSETRGSQVMV